MEETVLWIARAIIIVIGLALLMAVFAFLRSAEEVDRERFEDRDKPYLSQKKQIGNAFGRGSTVPRWQAWLGVSLPFLLFGIVWLLSKQ